MVDLLYPDESYKIIGACMEVHRILGSGFLESVYQDALKIEFEKRGIPAFSQAPIEVYYKDNKLHSNFKADFFCYEDIIVEIKSVTRITPEHEAQIINYLKATRVQLGLLINFGSKSLEQRRFINQL